MSIAAPLKTKMAASGRDLRLTISLEECGELAYSLSDPEWLAEKRGMIFQAFL
jgi:hypothetical protein